ncbi:MAG: metal-dependent transcriptional regulator [Flavobacterium sp.]
MTIAEENYLKTIFHLSENQPEGVSTNAIAQLINSKASSVSDMLKKLSDKEWIEYKKYQGVKLTSSGLLAAKMVVRRHRLWEVFLVEKLGFAWDEVHEMAEELEHIQSNVLIDKLEHYLGFPQNDPHGDPIPNAVGQLPNSEKVKLTEIPLNTEVELVGVDDSSSAFLQYLDKNKIGIGALISIIDKEDFDQSMEVVVNGISMRLSEKMATNLFVKK